MIRKDQIDAELHRLSFPEEALDMFVKGDLSIESVEEVYAVTIQAGPPSEQVDIVARVDGERVAWYTGRQDYRDTKDPDRVHHTVRTLLDFGDLRLALIEAMTPENVTKLAARYGQIIAVDKKKGREEAGQ